MLRSESPSGKCAKLHTVAASNNRDHPTRSLYYCFAPHIYIGVILRAHPVRGESHIQRNVTREVATTSPPNPTKSHVFCEGCTWHNLHIPVTAPFCCDRKARTTSVQTVAASNNRDHPTRSLSSLPSGSIINCSPGSQARDHSPRSLYRNHSNVVCSRRMCMSVVLRAHSLRGESHSHNAFQAAMLQLLR